MSGNKYTHYKCNKSWGAVREKVLKMFSFPKSTEIARNRIINSGKCI